MMITRVKYDIPPNFDCGPICVNIGTNPTVCITTSTVFNVLTFNNPVALVTTNCCSDWAWPPTTNTTASSNGVVTINLLPVPLEPPVLLIVPTNSSSATNYVLILANGIANYTWQIVYTNRLSGTNGWRNLTQTPTVIPNPAVPVSIPIVVPDPSDPSATNRFYDAVWVTCPSQ